MKNDWCKYTGVKRFKKHWKPAMVHHTVVGVCLLHLLCWNREEKLESGFAGAGVLGHRVYLGDAQRAGAALFKLLINHLQDIYNNGNINIDIQPIIKQDTEEHIFNKNDDGFGFIDLVRKECESIGINFSKIYSKITLDYFFRNNDIYYNLNIIINSTIKNNLYI